MGNGTETTYNYDEKRLHLNTMSLTSNGVKMMENVYKYDNVDNILGISNAAAPSGEIGGTYSHTYAYDELNRLISASGTAKDQTYEQLMRYDVMSNPLQKDSVSYEYNTPNHPNAVSSAGNKLFSYDANGNPISVEDTSPPKTNPILSPNDTHNQKSITFAAWKLMRYDDESLGNGHK